jgi:hypothetical protein
MIRSLVDMRAIGPELATLLVREAFSRPIANRRALGSYVGLAGGGSEREQGIGKDGNRRVRAAMVELAWLWLRWQPDSTLSAWLRERGRESRWPDPKDHDRGPGQQASHCPMALCQGRRHSGGSEDEDGIRTTFVFVHFR